MTAQDLATTPHTNSGETELRTNKYLNREERHYIHTRLKAGDTRMQIAAALGRDRRTIDREVSRGMYQYRRGGEPVRFAYDYRYAQKQADIRATGKGRQLKIDHDHIGEAAIAKLIKNEGYSPAAAIAKTQSRGLLKHYFCLKSYYNWVEWGYVSVSKEDLPFGQTRRARKFKRYTYRKHDPERPRIKDRPKTIDKRIEFGHWEGDLIMGPAGTPEALLTLVERKSRFGIVAQFDSRHSKHIVELIDSLEKKCGPLFSKIFKSITFDNGQEFSDWRGISGLPLGRDPTNARLQVYFARPYCSGDRGSNENWNGLLRRKITKGTDIGTLKKADVQQATLWLNTYPRKILNFQSSKEVFDKELSKLAAA